MKKELIEGVHFYYNELGYMVLTARYHMENGQCCGNGCMNCPYEYINVPEPRRTELRQKTGNTQLKKIRRSKERSSGIRQLPSHLHKAKSAK